MFRFLKGFTQYPYVSSTFLNYQMYMENQSELGVVTSADKFIVPKTSSPHSVNVAASCVRLATTVTYLPVAMTSQATRTNWPLIGVVWNRPQVT